MLESNRTVVNAALSGNQHKNSLEIFGATSLYTYIISNALAQTVLLLI